MTIQEDVETNAPTEITPRTGAKYRRISRGTILSRYVIIEHIGSGGMGTVYRAYDPDLNRGVALKIVSLGRRDLGEVERAKKRLIREAQALAQLSHPNVVAVHDVGSFADDVFIAMELVEGKTLKAWMLQGKKSLKEILEVMSAAGRGLAAAHQVGLVHRDFKPRNVIVGNDGRVRVLDFGLARAVGQEESLEKNSTELPDGYSSEKNMLVTPLTRFGGIVGSPKYMAPEQHMGLKTDERTDQFSFCVVLYEALYGVRPFDGKTIEELRKNVINNIVVEPENIAEVPSWLRQQLLIGLQKKPSDRHPSLDVLLEKLKYDPEQIAQQRRAERNRKLFIFLLIILTTVLPIGIWYGLRYRTFQLCQTTESELAGIWDQQTKTSIRKAFLDTQKSYARGTWQRVEKTFNDYLTQWTQMRSEICEARWMSATQSEELFDLRMSCLSKRRQNLKALTKVFAKADAEVLQKAVQASSSLDSIALCADEDALRAPYPPPKTKQAQERVSLIREKSAEVEALVQTGKYREGLTLTKMLQTETNDIDYRPLRAEVLYQLGDLFERTGEYQDAEKVLYQAASLAGASKHNKIAAMAITNLAFVLGYDQAQHDDGLLLCKSAEVIIGLSGGDEALWSQLYNNTGAVYWRKAKYHKALAYYRKALAIDEKTLGPDHPEVAAMLNNIAVVFETQGEYDLALQSYRKALATFERALGSEHPVVAVALNNMALIFLRKAENQKALHFLLSALAIDEKALGPNHPDLAYDLNSLGLVYWKSAQFDEALAYYSKALAIWETAFGPDHPLVAEALSGIGNVLVDQSHPEQAIELLTRVLRICKNNTCQPEPHGRGLFALARAMVLTKKNLVHAIEIAKQAKEEFGKAAYLAKERKAVDAWLKRIQS